MKITLIIVGSVIGLFALVYIAGFFISKSHIASVSMTFKAPVANVWSIVTDYKAYPDWRGSLASIDEVREAEWVEVSKNGDKINYKIEIAVPEKQFVNRITSQDLLYGGFWQFELESLDNGCMLTIAEHGEIYNPMFRTISLFMSKTATIEAFLGDLKKKIELE